MNFYQAPKRNVTSTDETFRTPNGERVVATHCYEDGKPTATVVYWNGAKVKEYKTQKGLQRFLDSIHARPVNIIKDMKVKFRDDFSAALRGMTFIIDDEPRMDNSAIGGPRLYVSITPVMNGTPAKTHARSAYTDDLRTMDDAPLALTQ